MPVKVNLTVKGHGSTIPMASQNHTVTTSGSVCGSVKVLDREYDLEFDAMENLCMLEIFVSVARYELAYGYWLNQDTIRKKGITMRSLMKLVYCLSEKP